MFIELFIVAIVLVLILYLLDSRDANFPPGPMGLPVLGHLPMLGTAPHKTLWKWKDTYGAIIGIRFGSYRAIVLNDANLIREALNMSEFSGRPMFNYIKSRHNDGVIRGIGFAEGLHWNEQRRFAMKNLRDFGGKTMEDNIQEEIQEFFMSLKEANGKPTQGRDLFLHSTINVVWRILFSDRLPYNDPDTQGAMKGLVSFIEETDITSTLSIFLPWLATAAPNLSGYKKMIEGFPMVCNFLQMKIKEHSINYIENHPRDFVDAYTDEILKTTDSHSSFHPNQDFLVDSLFDIFAAGSDTVSTTLSWLCAYLIVHKEVQEKLQKEIDEVVGRHRAPVLTDRQFMPYTEAVISEVMRFSSIAPFALFHTAIQDTEFHRFQIPKDTLILPNVYGVHFDPSIWGDPLNFRPERFIDANGKFNKNDNLFPFSTGKRVCLGEGLARNELFLFTTNLFQTFCLTSAGKSINLEPDLRLVLLPKPFEIIFKLRPEEGK